MCSTTERLSCTKEQLSKQEEKLSSTREQLRKQGDELNHQQERLASYQKAYQMCLHVRATVLESRVAKDELTDAMRQHSQRIAQVIGGLYFIPWSGN
jgi:chromosome segregation ATPase